MNWDEGTFLVALAVLAVQAYTVYLTAGLKLWVVEHFLSKEDYYRDKGNEKGYPNVQHAP